MKKTILLLVLIMSFLLSINIASISAETNDTGEHFSHYMVDYDSGTVLSKYRENERSEIASMVKIMTLNIVFDAIANGDVSLDDEVKVSHHAASATGSELFIEEGASYTVGDLVKGVIVVSANDASIALAEKIANNDDNFVALMNRKAQEWGMNDTHFVNVTGLPKEGQYSTAKDVSVMMCHLLSHEEYHDLAKIWTENYTHPSGNVTNLTNTNKLIRFYDGCDGGKTGFTNNAMFCLSATAKRSDMRIVCTVLGAPSSKARFKITSDLMNSAFRDYKVKVIRSKDELIDNDIKVKGARGKRLDIALSSDIKWITGRDVDSNVELRYDIDSTLVAPIHVGDKVGICHVYDGDRLVKSVDIVARNDVSRNNIFDNFRHLAG